MHARNTRLYTVVIHPSDPDETGYWAEVPALPGCFTQGETVEETVTNAQEAIQSYLESVAQLGQPIPREQDRAGDREVLVQVDVPEVA